MLKSKGLELNKKNIGAVAIHRPDIKQLRLNYNAMTWKVAYKV